MVTEREVLTVLPPSRPTVGRSTEPRIWYMAVPTIVVVWTTITLVVLKVFDIVLAMTNGQWETQVLANYMYDKLFRSFDWGVGSAAAMIIMLLVSPILIWNVYSANKEMR